MALLVKAQLKEKYKNIALIVVIVGAAFLCYANSFGVPFLWDDEVLVLRNHFITNWSNLGEIFKTGHFQGAGESGNFFRPIQIVSYFFDYFLWRFNAFGFHLTNLALHCLTSLLAYFLIKKITLNNLAGFFAGLFFAVHPVHTETVTYISGRADLLCAVFLLSAFLFFIKIPQAAPIKRYVYWLASCIFYILALFSRENALIFLFLTLLFALCFNKRNKFRFWFPVFISFFVITAAYIFFRLNVLTLPKISTLSLIAQASLIHRLLTIPKIFLFYLGLLIFPVHLHMERHFVVANWHDPYFWLGVILLCFTIWFIKLIFRNKNFRVELFFTSWFILTLIPVLNIMPLNATMAEHWLYLPSIGFLGLSLALLQRLFGSMPKKRRKIFFLAASLLFIFYCARTIIRNYQWQDPLKFYEHDLKYSSNSFLLHNNLGVELFRKGKMDKAGKEFEAAIKISPTYATSHNNLGVVMENNGMLNSAISEYRAAIDLNDYILAYANLGRLYLKMNKPNEAIEVLEKGKKLYPLDNDIDRFLRLAHSE